MYLDVLRPRNFDAPDLQTEIPSDTAFYFWYQQFEASASEAGRLLVKDVKSGADQWASLA